MENEVLVVGAGPTGLAMAVGLGAQVQVLDKSADVLRRLDDRYGNRIQTLYATNSAIEEALLQADLVVGAVAEELKVKEKDLL